VPVVQQHIDFHDAHLREILEHDQDMHTKRKWPV
jgi:hypothetical protein